MKDAKGHGSNTRGGPARPIPNSPYHAKSDAELRYIAKDAAEAGRNAQGMGDERGVSKYADQVADAASVMGYRNRGGFSDHPADVASREVTVESAKSTKVPTHESMSGIGVTPGRMSSADAAAHETLRSDRLATERASEGRHGYNRDAVNNAIASSNRAGRRIGGKEANAIHRLLRGR